MYWPHGYRGVKIQGGVYTGMEDTGEGGALCFVQSRRHSGRSWTLCRWMGGKGVIQSLRTKLATVLGSKLKLLHPLRP